MQFCKEILNYDVKLFLMQICEAEVIQLLKRVVLKDHVNISNNDLLKM